MIHFHSSEDLLLTLVSKVRVLEEKLTTLIDDKRSEQLVEKAIEAEMTRFIESHTSTLKQIEEGQKIVTTNIQQIDSKQEMAIKQIEAAKKGAWGIPKSGETPHIGEILKDELENQHKETWRGKLGNQIYTRY